MGHFVHATGQVWEGWQYPESDADVRRLAEVVDEVLETDPDVVLAMRPAALHPRQLAMLSRRGVLTVAWYADDPVFFKYQSGAAAQYDLTLHTALAPVLTRYEREVGVRGIGFPFWASQDDFPRCYRPAECDVDVVFIGNTHTRVKQWRYDWLVDLPVSKVMYGRAKEDPAGIVAGFLTDTTELAQASARGRFGLNISQRFSDYQGSRFDFPGLTEFGEFPLPSRVVELAAAGVPVLALVDSEQAGRDLQKLFPPVVVVHDGAEALAVITATSTADLAELSEGTHAWYQEYYTAAARARFLHAVLGDPQRFRRLSADERALAFLDYPTPTTAEIEQIRTDVLAETRWRWVSRLGVILAAARRRLPRWFRLEPRRFRPGRAWARLRRAVRNRSSSRSG